LDTYQQLKRLVLFQLKLAADALRDLLLSPIALLCVVMDLIQKPKPEKSNYNKLMAFGRKTDSIINLFEHKQNKESANTDEAFDIDGLASQIEDIIKREYQEQHLSKKVKLAIQKKIAERKPHDSKS